MAESRPHSRIKSATARLTPPGLQKPLQIQQAGVKERQKRVSSAKLNREKQNSSKKVFPRPSSAEKKERYKTVYNKDFEGMYQPPTEPRPTSPTRRNNPHPSQVCILACRCGLEWINLLVQLLCNYDYSNLWYGECPPGK